MKSDITELNVPEWEDIREDYIYWQRFLKQEIVFRHSASVIHNVDHCARVLLHALRIAYARGLKKEDVTALCAASVFHDAGRIEDGLDTGHGCRSAHYYRDYCREHDLLYDERAYLSMYFHDRPDEKGKEAFLKNGLADDTIIYLIFKDSDGLDRLRLGEGFLDVDRLRTDEAVAMVDFARSIAHTGSEELLRMLENSF